MKSDSRICVIIPALDEEDAIGRVLAAIPAWVDQIIVVDNGSRDNTADVARTGDACVIREPRRGYGRACKAGWRAARTPDVCVFMDADYSDYPEEMERLVAPVVDDQAELVIGVRAQSEAGALSTLQRLGNHLVCGLIKAIWGVPYHDLGPFRAIKESALARLDMRDNTYGWTVEMQIKAIENRLRVLEVPVSYRQRIGRSKISGSIRGSVSAGLKILYTIVRLALKSRHRNGRHCAKA